MLLGESVTPFCLHFTGQGLSPCYITRTVLAHPPNRFFKIFHKNAVRYAVVNCIHNCIFQCLSRLLSFTNLFVENGVTAQGFIF